MRLHIVPGNATETGSSEGHTTSFGRYINGRKDPVGVWEQDLGAAFGDDVEVVGHRGFYWFHNFPEMMRFSDRIAGAIAQDQPNLFLTHSMGSDIVERALKDVAAGNNCRVVSMAGIHQPDWRHHAAGVTAVQSRLGVYGNNSDHVVYTFGGGQDHVIVPDKCSCAPQFDQGGVDQNYHQTLPSDHWGFMEKSGLRSMVIDKLARITGIPRMDKA